MRGSSAPAQHYCSAQYVSSRSSRGVGSRKPIPLLPRLLPMLCRPPGAGMRLVGASPSCLEYVLPRRLGVRMSSSSMSPGSKRLTLAERPWTLPPSELRGRLIGVRTPERLARLWGRGGGGGCISVLLAGRAIPDEMLARELGRDADASESPLGALLGRGPNESRPIPEVLSRGMCLEPCVLRRICGVWVGVVSPLIIGTLAVEPVARFLDRIVTDEGTLLMPRADPTGDTRGGVFKRDGSLERAVCTRASKRCTCAVRVRI